MQQVGSAAAYVAAKLLSLLPTVTLTKFDFTVRQKQKIKTIASFFLLFVFPSVSVYGCYDYVQSKGGFLSALSNFGHLHLKQVNLTVYQKDKLSHSSEWHVNPEEIKAALPVKMGNLIFDMNPEKIRQMISDVPWVKSTTVKLILPSTLSITIDEQVPFALWQKDETFYLIDENGAEITSKNLDRYNYLPWVVGYGANTRIYEYAALMKDYADIFKYVKSAYRVGNRRWTLVTHNNTEISLSENNPRASLERLALNQKKYNILEEDISMIDLRIADKLFVKQRGSATLSIYSGQNT